MDNKLAERMSSSKIEMLNSSRRNLSKIKRLYTSIMCFVANCLSSVALEVASKSSLGNSVNKSTTFAFFRRNYNLKIRILLTNVISGFIATLMLTLGDKYKYPYLYIPWLLNTIQGIALFEGPALLNSAYKLIPHAEVPARTFLFITVILFIEEIFVWNEVFWSFKKCWAQYDYRKKRTINTAKEKADNENRRLPTTVKKDVDLKFARSEISIPSSESEVELSKLLRANTNSSNDSIVSAPCSENHNNHIRNLIDVTG
ncbi:uncharacterized protein LOC117171478 [Belonocnema kinseyi]|uniref:uncharacterized protein LOC117171478 n=1 Tax=Belonocnema kinseyi TaxID=2817044 RepID=UPI00143CF911|nr:uncharacterized protein LOC117171478 [Belonocnema kinseyi]